MESYIETLMKQLPSSPIELSEKNRKKIHQLLPVPSDYTINWADILSFGGYPCGVVLTDQGIIIKAPKSTVKKENARRKNEQTDESGEDEPLKVLFQIIPWEYFEPSSFTIVKLANGHYSLRVNGAELTEFSNPDLSKFINNCSIEDHRIKEQIKDTVENATLSGIGTIDLENTAYHAAYGADQTKTGHGNYAEDAGVILDRLHGQRSTGTGRNIDPSTGHYPKNGPDKIVEGVPIQCKYYKTAGSSVGACFAKDPVTGKIEFRYKDINGNPMPIEVAKDQYDKAVKAMEARIEKGQVPGITDKSAAKDLIRRGFLTKQQARNLAKAGTFESLSYDAVTGIVSCSAMCGISALVSFGIVYWQTKDMKEASRAALSTGIQVFGPAFASRILVAQIARTGLSDMLIPATTAVSKTLSPQTVQRIVNALRSLAGKKAIYGAAAQKSFAKTLRSTAIAQGIMFVVMSVPDTVRLSTRTLSSAQYAKNMTSMAASFAGYAASSYGAGIAFGKVSEKVAEKYRGKVGGVVGFCAGMVGGTCGSMVVRGIGNLFREDDALITARLFNAVICNLCIDFLLSKDEVNAVIEQLDQKKKEIGKLQRKLIASKRQYRDIETFLTPIFEEVVSKRPKIDANLEAEMLLEFDDAITEAANSSDEEDDPA